MYDCCLYDTPRTFEWYEANCEKYYSCDTVALAMNAEKKLDESNGKKEL
jgi:hypothetical protein